MNNIEEVKKEISEKIGNIQSVNKLSDDNKKYIQDCIFKYIDDYKDYTLKFNSEVCFTDEDFNFIDNSNESIESICDFIINNIYIEDKNSNSTTNNSTAIEPKNENPKQSTIGDCKGRILENANRNIVNDKKRIINDIPHIKIFGFYSREASGNFSKKYHYIPSLISHKDNKVNNNESIVPSSNFQSQITKLYENRYIPDVIIVAEGTNFPENFKINEFIYTRVLVSKGLNKNSKPIAVQNMGAYVRTDKENEYCFQEITLKDPNFKAIGINYCFNCKCYQTLAVHIPNNLVKQAHQIITDHATEKKKENIIVTSYFGDTNYIKPFQNYSNPSIGGHLLGDEKFSFPKSSTALRFTNFMQAIDISDKNDQSLYILQPSMLNHIKLTPDENKEGIDHPSINHYVLHVN